MLILVSALVCLILPLTFVVGTNASNCLENLVQNDMWCVEYIQTWPLLICYFTGRPWSERFHQVLGPGIHRWTVRVLPRRKEDQVKENRALMSSVATFLHLSRLWGHNFFASLNNVIIQWRRGSRGGKSLVPLEFYCLWEFLRPKILSQVQAEKPHVGAQMENFSTRIWLSDRSKIFGCQKIAISCPSLFSPQRRWIRRSFFVFHQPSVKALRWLPFDFCHTAAQVYWLFLPVTAVSYLEVNLYIVTIVNVTFVRATNFNSQQLSQCISSM